MLLLERQVAATLPLTVYTKLLDLGGRRGLNLLELRTLLE